LFVAERFPGCSVVAVSNSATQRDFIERRAKDRGFSNVNVITAEVAGFDSQDFRDKFDRIMSIGNGVTESKL
jgi:cyclopropane-fatty-acyl-phospholipid synthase